MYVIAGWMRRIAAGRGVVVNSDCGVGGVVNDDAVESENVGDGVRELEGGDGSAVACTAFVIGSNTRTRLPSSIGSEQVSDRGVVVVVVVVVVVAVKGERKVVNLGGPVLYIFTEPLVQLTPPEMGVYPGLRSSAVGV